MNPKCVLILGPMFAGKTTELLSRCERYELAGKKVYYIKPDIDKRYGKISISTHKGYKVEAEVVDVELDTRILSHMGDASAICIDEGQFFMNLKHFVKFAMSRGIDIYISALNGDFQGNPFDSISSVLPIATDVVFVSGVDRTTGADSHYTIRLSDDVNQVAVGGDEMYRGACYESLPSWRK